MGNWWNSIVAGDFDNDGDIDYAVSNLGGNSFYKASNKYPVSVYAKDFYNQGIVQCILTSFIKDRQGGQLKEFAADSRDDLVTQLLFLNKLRSSDGKYLIAASQNRGPLKMFFSNKSYSFVPLNADDVVALITYRDGRRQRRETGYGNSFLSQSGRFITVNGPIALIEITNSKGKTRIITPALK